MLFFTGLPPEMDFRGLLAGASLLVNTGAVMPRAFLISSLWRNVINEGKIFTHDRRATMSKKKPEITFKYVFNYGYNPSYVNGAQGGFSPRGEMVINFYLERQPLPESISHEITPEGAIGSETAVTPVDLAQSMVRYIDTGVVMNYENARVFHAWLGDKLREVEEMNKARSAFESAPAAGQA
jgi:hypothetical protein